MEVGIAYDLKSEVARHCAGAGPSRDSPEDLLEEYDQDETVRAIAAALQEEGHQPRLLGGGRAFLEEVDRRPPELVFNIAEGRGGRSREAQVPSVLEILGIPYTHSDPLALALSLDKALAKQVVAAAGVATPEFAVVEEPAGAERVELSFPVLAKPLCEGSSMGIRRSSRIPDPAALRSQVEWLLHAYQQPVLVEEFCPGPEFTVGILGTDGEARSIGVMEIRPRRAAAEEFIYSLEVKRNYLEEVEYRVPPDRPAAPVRAVEELALRAFQALRCRDVARVDVRIGADGGPKFLEINPLPGLNPVTGDIVILAERSGLPYRGLIGGILRSARRRHGL